MFVDVDERGEMVVSWRNMPAKRGEEKEYRQGDIHGGGVPRELGMDELPEGELYVVDGAYDGSYAPRYITASDGTQFVRVGINAARRGIYVKAPASSPSHSHPEEQHVRRQRRVPRKPAPTQLPDDFYHPGPKGQYPRPMRRVDNKNKPLPRVPRERNRRRRSLIGAIKEVVRRLSAGSGGRIGVRRPSSYHQAGYYV